MGRNITAAASTIRSRLTRHSRSDYWKDDMKEMIQNIKSEYNRMLDATFAESAALIGEVALRNAITALESQAAEIAQARTTADYWKAELNEANAEIAELRERVPVWVSVSDKVRKQMKGSLCVTSFAPVDRERQYLSLDRLYEIGNGVTSRGFREPDFVMILQPPTAGGE